MWVSVYAIRYGILNLLTIKMITVMIMMIIRRLVTRATIIIKFEYYNLSQIIALSKMKKDLGLDIPKNQERY